MEETEGFRNEARQWLEENCPSEMRTPVDDLGDLFSGGRRPEFSSPAQKRWFELMAERGWTVPDWPLEYGGGGLSVADAKALRGEMADLGCRTPLSSFGISMLAPALFKYGTEEQKRRFLPPIARGEIRWCQGYSEPNAGSDLASLATRAADAGDHFIVNGQKVWTSYADKADWIFCLVRTNPSEKHGGITFLLFDMASPGVTTRPITLISGRSPFCETFFDNVKVPKTQVVGEINRGWDVAKFLLGHERELISGMGLKSVGPSLGKEAVALHGTDSQGRLASPILRARLANYDVRAAAFEACSERFLDQLKAAKAHPAQPSMMKYFGTELNKLRNEIAMSIGGFAALEWDSKGSRNGVAARGWLRSKGNSIEGGTSEIQLNIIAKHILSLPGA